MSRKKHIIPSNLSFELNTFIGFDVFRARRSLNYPYFLPTVYLLFTYCLLIAALYRVHVGSFHNCLDLWARNCPRSPKRYISLLVSHSILVLTNNCTRLVSEHKNATVLGIILIYRQNINKNAGHRLDIATPPNRPQTLTESALPIICI